MDNKIIQSLNMVMRDTFTTFYCYPEDPTKYKNRRKISEKYIFLYDW